MAEIQTNCGNIPTYNPISRTNSFVNDQLKTVGKPTLTNRTIPYFHQAICDWAYNVPLKFNWVLFIKPTNPKYLLGQIKRLNYYYEKGNNAIWDVAQGSEDTTQPAVQEDIGCIFAQGVNIPGENVAIDYAGISDGSKRGFVNSPYINGRGNFEPLEVGFLETNQSFVDTFLRPWSIIVSHKGLIATPQETNLKATITVHQLARIGTDQNSIIRKTFTFEDCAPINISTENLDYSPSSDYPKMQAKFAYNRYTVTSYNSVASPMVQSSPLIAMSQPAVNQAIANGAGMA
jgi:hypothetical protein